MNAKRLPAQSSVLCLLSSVLETRNFETSDFQTFKLSNLQTFKPRNPKLETRNPKLKTAYEYWLKANASLKSIGIYELPLPDALQGYQAGLGLDE